MKTTFKTISMALLLSLTAAGCQKDFSPIEPTGSEQASTIRTMVYTIDGKSSRITLKGESEWQEFANQMLALAREGHSVFFFNENTYCGEKGNRDVVTYETSSKSDATRWSRLMSDQGYVVDISYDENSGIYTCTAVKPDVAESQTDTTDTGGAK